jgi:polyisoprenoid-binding protein YceI
MIRSARRPGPRPVLVAALLALLPPAGATGGEPPAALDLVVGAPSTIRYHLAHTLHDVVGVSSQVEGTARLAPEGTVTVELRARVDGFDSGNGSRDAKMLEVTDAAHFPLVEVKAAGSVTPPASYPATVDVTLTGQLTFHGHTQPLQAPVHVTFSGPGAATATTTFPISLKAFQVEPPSLLFQTITDRAIISASLALSSGPPAP